MFKKLILSAVAAIGLMVGLMAPASAAMVVAKPAVAANDAASAIVQVRGRRGGFRRGGLRRRGGFRRGGFRRHRWGGRRWRGRRWGGRRWRGRRWRGRRWRHHRRWRHRFGLAIRYYGHDCHWFRGRRYCDYY